MANPCVRVCCRVRPLRAPPVGSNSNAHCSSTASLEATPVGKIKRLHGDSADSHLESRSGRGSISATRAAARRQLGNSPDSTEVVLDGYGATTRSKNAGRRRNTDRWGFTFDDVLENGCEQEEVYRRCARDIVHSVLAGVNGTVLACE